jgi:hypothetical protein
VDLTWLLLLLLLPPQAEFCCLAMRPSSYKAMLYHVITNQSHSLLYDLGSCVAVQCFGSQCLIGNRLRMREKDKKSTLNDIKR